MKTNVDGVITLETKSVDKAITVNTRLGQICVRCVTSHKNFRRRSRGKFF